MVDDTTFHPLVEGTSAALFVYDDERILYINPASRSLTGYTARELLDRPFDSLLHPRHRASYGGDAPRTRAFREQVEILDSRGESRWVELSLQPILFRGRARTLATMVDIDPLKQSDLARRETEVQLKLARRAGRTVSWDWHVASDQLIIYGLPKNLTGEESPTLTTTGRAFFDRLSSEDLRVLKQSIRLALREKEPLFVEISLMDTSGQPSWVVLRARPVSGLPTDGEHLVGVATDITDRRRAELVLIEEQEYNLAMLASISDGVIRTNLDGRILDLSTQAEAILGTGPVDPRGRTLADVVTFIDQETGEALPDPIEACLASGEPLSRPQTCLVRPLEGEDMPVQFHTAVLRDHQSERTGIVLVIKDMAEHRQFEKGMVYLATHDPLTDLVNRSEFERRLSRCLGDLRHNRQQDSLLHLDLDGFTLLNDTFGPAAGDGMLKQFASFLKCRFRETDTLARFGGDKFGILLESCPPWQARELVQKLYADLRSFRFEWEETRLPLSLSTGLAPIGPQQMTVEQALASAEEACRLAKLAGGDRLHEFQPADSTTAGRHSQTEILQCIQEALEGNAISLKAQRIRSLSASETSPDLFEIQPEVAGRSGQPLDPAVLGPVAERHDVGAALDRWIFTHSLETIAAPDRPTPVPISISIAGPSLADDRFLEFVLYEIDRRDIDPACLHFEISENVSASNFDRAQRFVSVLKGRGCRIILSDFGSGLSSFSHLRDFPVDFLKIDGQLIRGLHEDATQRALVESIHHVGQAMEIRTIAATVDSQECLEILRQIDVDYVQGPQIGLPESLAEVVQRHDSRRISA